MSQRTRSTTWATATTTAENLQALCERHHKRKSAAKGNVSHRPRPSHFRRPERHPETP
ncbi:hypothetical protein [Nocardiopsis tropica]|uniref:HNH endonuclease n=1 Tax=Nocardiopsis tropica TaxID=109330 RepID=A0ABU7KKF5_9ACTN|nr:hypothetical protein [Nocardiopsis umidischolae]MEE2049772.1 hypothetical protein [Nocardiopsis umidischolae]